MRRFAGTLGVMLFLVQLCWAQSTIHLSGKVLDMQGLAVPNATLYLSGTTIGTSSSPDGEFSLVIPQSLISASNGITLVVRSVGFNATQWKWKSGDPWPSDLVLQLEEEVFQLEEVSVTQKEDPAYAIIRKAIEWRKTHLEAVPNYEAKVYIKGTQRMLKAPEKFLGIDMNSVGQELGLDSNRTGILYFSESESKITFVPPSLFKEEMISSKVSGRNNAFSINRASDLQINFYENYQNIVEGLAPRPFVSPIADQALSYYRYQYQGFQEQDGLLINKIRVIPRRKMEPLYEGFIYITEGTWRIYSVDLFVTKDAGIAFVDTLGLKQDYVPFSSSSEEVWMPSNSYITFSGGFFGFRFGGNFTAMYSNYAFAIAALPKKAFREVLKISKEVNEKNDVYWEENRPIALTDEERLDYIKKDSLQARRNSAAYLDSLDRRSNKFRPVAFLIGGYTHSNRKARSSLEIDGLLSSLAYNTVEGLVAETGITYRKRLDSASARSWSIGGDLRYGFSNERLNGSIHSSISTGRQSSLQLAFGSEVLDLNTRGTISSLANSYYTLLFGRNPLKIYERGIARAQWNTMLPGNVSFSISGRWEDRRWLENSTNYSFVGEKSQKFTHNNPYFPDKDGQSFDLFTRHQAFILRIQASYDFATHYETYPNGRRYLPSKYPRLTLSYTNAIHELLRSDVGYQLLTAQVQKSNISLGLYGRFSFAVIGGSYFKRESMNYVDAWHFKGTNTLLSSPSLHSFLLLDPYVHSESKHFVEGHVEYNLATLLTSKIPLIRRLKLQESIGVHVLRTSAVPKYGELHLGLERSNLKVIYARAWQHESLGSFERNSKHAIRIGFFLF